MDIKRFCIHKWLQHWMNINPLFIVIWLKITRNEFQAHIKLIWVTDSISMIWCCSIIYCLKVELSALFMQFIDQIQIMCYFHQISHSLAACLFEMGWIVSAFVFFDSSKLPLVALCYLHIIIAKWPAHQIFMKCVAFLVVITRTRCVVRLCTK